MNFQNMEYFLTVVTEGSITKAADSLHITQQALSNHIARIEDELGCTLFDRRQNLELTYSGKQFYESCQKILDIHRQTTSAIDDINNNQRGELRIGISFTRGQAILPLLLPRFSMRYPQAELHVVEGSTHVLEEDLQKGAIDVLIGFAPFMVECAEYQALMKERLFLIVPDTLLRRHFGDDAQMVFQQYQNTADISLFKELPFVLLKEGDRIRTLVNNEFRKKNFKPHVVLETANTQTAFNLAAEGMGLTVCPELYLQNPYVVSGIADSQPRKHIRFARFVKGDVYDTIAIGYNRERYISALAKSFIDMSIEAFKEQPPIR